MKSDLVQTDGASSQSAAAPQESAPLQPGDVIVDNDPRTCKRILTVVELLPFGGPVLARDSAGRKVHMQRRRIYTDGKPRKSGYSRVREGKA